MEFKGYEGSHRHPKRRKPVNHAQFCATSIQDSSFNRVSFLPAELITEILLRLPVKSLLQFRCVSKSWLASISSPEFVKTHLSVSANNKEYRRHRLMLRFDPPYCSLQECSFSSLLNESVTEAFDLDYPMKISNKFIWIVGSVNGLICLAIEDKQLFLWNPSIRKFKKLPDSRATMKADSFFMYGFGYDEIHDDYRVVVGFRSLGFFKVEIYSLNSDSWRSIDDFPSGVLSMKSGMLVNGKLHWANTAFQDLPSYNARGIISIDLANGKWGKVEQPCYGEGDFDSTLGVLGSDLSLFCNYQRIHADVWVWKEYGVKESWTKMFTINLPYDPVGYQCCPFFCMSNKGGILFQFGSTFMIYNPKDHSIRYSEITCYNAFYEADIFIESLVWPLFAKEPRMQQQRRLEKLR
ncbi:hypothetical protein HAX54_011695 [Datura stramonium]|uniref:F-box domain-containing protein n=1 Tax=Datura stramonium TaxID=4076 RepID=A0ABS8RXQ4_DATST|nr:hypothetical protein [Datura stramonium]